MSDPNPSPKTSSAVSLPILDQQRIDLDRDEFLRTMLRELSGALQEIVGLEEAEGYISVVGRRLGEHINGLYARALGTEKLDREHTAAAMVDLKQRIQGDFFVLSADADKIVLGNRRCPFEEKVVGRPSLCMMTSNVFGYLASENLGYAKVAIEEAIARGDAGCRVVVHLTQNPESEQADGREYFRS